MVFNSLLFTFAFLPFIVVAYYLLKREKQQNIFLFFISLVIYFYGAKKLTIYLVISILVNYVIGLLIGKSKKCKGIILLLGLLWNFGLLFYFKYYNFTITNINTIFSKSYLIKNIVAPLGISFFTFRCVSYIVEVYWGNCVAQKNIINLGLYISFFPQVLSGPITSYPDFEGNLKQREFNIDKVVLGIKKFVIGLFKKMAIADCISMSVDNIFAMDATSRTVLLSWFGIFAYFIQLYFDFSGYSDMAIGVGNILGFDCPENFNYPYISKTATEYWQRWHITLGTWLKTYIYTPVIRLLCNHSIKVKNAYFIATLCVWLFAGIWHGAAWNYLLYGLYYFLFCVIEHQIIDYQKKRRKKLGIKKKDNKYINALLHLYFIVVLIFGQLIFRSSSISDFNNYVKNLFDFKNIFYLNKASLYIIKQNIIVFIIALPLCLPIKEYISNKLLNKLGEKGFNICSLIFYGVLMFIDFVFLFGSNASSFIYFNF